VFRRRHCSPLARQPGGRLFMLNGQAAQCTAGRSGSVCAACRQDLAGRQVNPAGFAFRIHGGKIPRRVSVWGGSFTGLETGGAVLGMPCRPIRKGSALRCACAGRRASCGGCIAGSGVQDPAGRAVWGMLPGMLWMIPGDSDLKRLSRIGSE